ncbi:MAG: type II toxin-antitoxin system VapC family toxin [Actinobacteria bacterium]|nr:type II toxin-antitoxin system VapC family toxin [Actinomycetota bacterium]
MLLVDTNVMIYAHRLEPDRHAEYRAWMDALIAGPEPYAVSDFALNGVIRVVTNRRIYSSPTPTLVALNFAEAIREQPHAHVVSPGARFWPIFRDLCLKTGASAKPIPDAYLAALALEHGCEVVSTDEDFRRFPGLRWRHPLN